MAGIGNLGAANGIELAGQAQDLMQAGKAQVAKAAAQELNLNQQISKALDNNVKQGQAQIGNAVA